MPTMRKSTLFLLFTTCTLILLVMTMLHAGIRQYRDVTESRQRATLVKELQLTDLCLFTEARYTRHPTMADLHSPFQDHPGAMEHFPSGSFATPPTAIMRPYAESR